MQDRTSDPEAPIGAPGPATRRHPPPSGRGGGLGGERIELSVLFREIANGNNDGYSTGPGWNPCCGLGSPKGSPLLGDLGT